MLKKDDIIARFRGPLAWIESLKKLDQSIWNRPMEEGKWSISEVVAHLMNWDQYLLSAVLPAVGQGEGIVFPAFEPFNEAASRYAKSGISKEALIEETLQSREELVTRLLEMPADAAGRHLSVNGVSHCSRTGNPYTLLYVIEEFIEHDEHHRQQVMAASGLA